jgi:D-threo-aldose 1-dehydrogenase
MGAALTTGGRLRLLETAFEVGIRHFDTAPLYGMGLAEEVLGRFARRRRSEITLTTKFGLVPPAIPAPLRPVVPLARILHRRLGWGRASLSRALAWRRGGPPPVATAPLPAPPPSASPPGGWPRPYDPAALRASLETSLRKLGTDHVDLLLLHECQPSQLTEEGLALMEALVAEGKIRHWGLGSGRASTRVILERWPGREAVVQIPDDLLRGDTAWFAHQAAPPLFTHSVMRGPLGDPARQPLLRALLQGWAERTGQDPAKPGLLGDLLFIGGLLNNAEGCVLFSSGRVTRVRALGELARRLPELGPPLREVLAEQTSGGPTTGPAGIGETAGGERCS